MTSQYMPPPGWYADPSGAPVRRWWNGQQWTDSVQQPPKRRSGRALKIIAVVLGLLFVGCLGLTQVAQDKGREQKAAADAFAAQGSFLHTLTQVELPADESMLALGHSLCAEVDAALVPQDRILELHAELMQRYDRYQAELLLVSAGQHLCPKYSSSITHVFYP